MVRILCMGLGLPLLLLSLQAMGQSDAATQAILDRLERLEEEQQRLREELRDRDRKIETLTNQLQQQQEQPVAPATLEPAPLTDPEELVAFEEPQPANNQGQYFGIFQPGGRGIKLANTPYGDMNFSAWTYIRYLNQSGLDNDYTDSFGREFEIDTRNDFQLNKVNLYFKGWVYDERLRYLLYTWTANTSQGDGAQVVVAGNLSYALNDNHSIAGGIGALPGTRSLRNTFPYWLKVDTRTIGDEFFRPSYTTGIWGQGKLADRWHYKLMLGNNLSQLGVNAVELDDGLNTWSGAVWWMPTTGEFGPAAGFGDFAQHEELATLFGLNFTTSTEDRQSQPGTEDIQNTQIRLSDGTVVFRPDAFDSGGRINELQYYMASFDAGVKYQGFALEAEYYYRMLDDFKTEGNIPVDDLEDHGVQLQLSMMAIPQLLQPYVAGSYIFGEYGEPWDVAVGVNWFPLRQQLFRINSEILYLDDSPVGYSSVPFAVGGKGAVFYTNVELMF